LIIIQKSKYSNAVDEQKVKIAIEYRLQSIFCNPDRNRYPADCWCKYLAWMLIFFSQLGMNSDPICYHFSIS